MAVLSVRAFRADNKWAFGAAALIYLIAEELLVEAIEAEESLFSTATLFAGFLVLLAIKLLSR